MSALLRHGGTVDLEDGLPAGKARLRRRSPDWSRAEEARGQGIRLATEERRKILGDWAAVCLELRLRAAVLRRVGGRVAGRVPAVRRRAQVALPLLRRALLVGVRGRLRGVRRSTPASGSPRRANPQAQRMTGRLTILATLASVALAGGRAQPAESAPACTAVATKAVARAFIAGFDAGRVSAINSLWAPEPRFEWFVALVDPARDSGPAAYNRATLAAWFRARARGSRADPPNGAARAPRHGAKHRELRR